MASSTGIRYTQSDLTNIRNSEKETESSVEARFAFDPLQKR